MGPRLRESRLLAPFLAVGCKFAQPRVHLKAHQCNSPELLPAEHVDEEVCRAVDADEEVAEVDDPRHPRRLDAPRRAEHHLVQVGDHLRQRRRVNKCELVSTVQRCEKR